MHDPLLTVPETVWAAGKAQKESRAIPNEVAIAITYSGSTQAVMMATPADLKDFAYGFSFTEGLINSPSDIESFEVVEEEQGIELRMSLAPELAETYSRRRRLLAGPMGCGLCGIESLAEAVKPARKVNAAVTFAPSDIEAAIVALPSAQALNRDTRAVHAAGFYVAGEGLVAVREDVGRHNALDKLVGHLIVTGHRPDSGIIVLTSRVSVEMVQKTAVFGTPVFAAVSAPTALAVKMAHEAGVTLIAVARGDSFEVFTHANRVVAATVTSAA